MSALNPKHFSTSNLYSPDPKRVEDYLIKYSASQIVEEFETRFANYHEAKHCVSFSTGFWALVAAILSKSLPGKSQIIMPSMTYRRLADVVNWTGKTPTFVDIDPENLAICPKAVEAAITSETSLLLAVHPIINCCAVDTIIKLGKDSGIPVLFDAVESVHETYLGRRIGGFGVGEVFSLHASKLINGVEGGYVCTSEEELARHLKEIKRYDQPGKGNYRIQADINPLHCAFALAGLDEIAQNVAHNKNVYEAYRQVLAPIPEIDLLQFDESEQTSYKNIVIRVNENSRITRDELVKTLNSHNIFARAHYSPALHRKTMAYPSKAMNLDTTERLEARYLNLPCGQRFDPASAATVAALIQQSISATESS